MKVIVKGMYYGAKAELFDLALLMRRNPTDAENAMWEILRRFRKSGYIFRRQHPIKFYIADFYCHKLRLVIEVDGEIHSKQEIKTHDEGRSGELENLGIQIMRFTNNQIQNDTDLVIERLNDTIQKLTSS